MSYTPIKEYGVIGNLRTAILVSKKGSIDWCCLPFFDSPSIFGAILDCEKGGSFQICPEKKFDSKQYYLKHTNILITEFTTKTGSAKITDFMPIYKKNIVGQKKFHEITRIVEGLSGKTRMVCKINPKFDYGKTTPSFKINKKGFIAYSKNQSIAVSANTSFEKTRNGLTTSFELKKKQRKIFVLRYNSKKNFNVLKTSFQKKLFETNLFWKNYSKKCKKCNTGVKWDKELERSGLILKLLTHEPTGAIIAAPTTSLPEVIGGQRNWDYRYAWLRDAGMTLQALYALELADNAEQFMKWLEHACCSVKKGIGILYKANHDSNLKEKELPHLSGYKNSKPVRIGNSAATQKQLDVYGEVMDAVLTYVQHNGKISEKFWCGLKRLADEVCNEWKKKDSGIWEFRSKPKHYVHSKVFCWVALDRIIKIAKILGKKQNKKWKTEMQKIKKDVLKNGWNPEKKCFVQYYNAEHTDASLLLLPVVGFISGTHKKMVSTIKRIKKELCENCFVYRYKCDDGLPGKEGAFNLCTFWFIDALALSGKTRKAINLFEKMLSKANHLGLFSEEINPKNNEFLGNFPQAYTHIGLINSTLLLRKKLVIEEKLNIKIK